MIDVVDKEVRDWFKQWREANGIVRRTWTLCKGDVDGAEVRVWMTPGGPVMEQVGPGDVHEVWLPAGGRSNQIVDSVRDLA